MKKTAVTFVLFLIVSSTLFASFQYQLDFLSFNPIHKEYFADRSRPDLSINYLFFFEGFPDRVLQDTYVDPGKPNHTVTVYPFEFDIPAKNKMVRLKLGETLSLFRNTFTFDNWLSPISFDFSMQGVLHFLFTGKFDDNIGYDGIFFYGATLSVADKVSMRIGMHHYCSHYGDAVLKNLSKQDLANLWITYKYVRMDTVAIGLSIEPVSWLRTYAEINFPAPGIESLRPDMFAPNWMTRDGHVINPDYPDSYNARIVNVGIEFSYPIFKKLGNTTLAYDLHMYEEGKVQYDKVEGGAVTFDENAPWELEHTVVLAQEINDVISIEVTYHNGRSPFNNMFFQHASYLSVGARFNPGSTVTLYKN